MAWVADTRPADHRISSTAQWRNVFLDTESVDITVTAGAATLYEVRNYYGTIVTSGTITGTTISLGVLPLGWYRIYFIRGSAIASPWFTAGGEDTFCVVRSTGSGTARPAFGTSRVASGGDTLTKGHDLPARAFTAIGSPRLTTPWGDSGSITGAGIDADYHNTWWTADSARPSRPCVSFDTSYGLVDDTTKDAHAASVVNLLMPKGVTYYEGFNEPNNFGSTVANTITQLGLFSSAIRAANASAKVMGPCTLKVSDSQLDWTQQVLVGAASSVDVISFHDYNGGQGSIPAMRTVLDRFEAMLVSIGQDTKPRYNTESGSAFMAVYGSFEPRLQAQWTLLEMHMLEQYKVPKENSAYFYDWNHGFWSFPSWWINNDSTEPHPGPLMALVRVWSQELFGKAYAARLDFGAENGQWVGSRFTDPSTGDSVVAIQSDGRSGQVTLTVTGSGSAMQVTPWGALSTLTPSGGTVTVAVDTLPLYVRTPSGTTVTPVAVDYGVEVALAQKSTAAASSVSPTGYEPAKAVNGIAGTDDTSGITSTPFRASDTDTLPAWWELTFPRTTRFDRVVVRCPRPWQQDGALLDFDVQIWTGAAWQTIATDSEPTTTFQWTSAKANGGCFVESFWSRRNVFHFKLASAVSTTKLRVYARDVTYGGGATVDTTNGGGVAGGATGQTGPRRLCLEEVSVYLHPSSDGGTAVAGQPTLPIK